MVYVFVSLFLYTAVMMFGTLASRNLNVVVASGIMCLISAVIPLLLAAPQFSKKIFIDQKYGILLAVCAGVLIALFTITVNKAYSVNKVSVVAPIVFGGSILLGSLLGTLLLKEKTTVTEMVGLAILAVGLGIIIYARVTAA